MNRIEAMKSKNYFAGFFVGSFKSRLDKEVSKLLALKDENGQPPTIETRKQIIEALLDAYIEQTGNVPDGVQIQRMGNWLLLEDLTNNHPDKVTREPYPFLTKRQLRTRYNRERADDTLQETHTIQRYLGGKKQPIFTKAE
ncbi:hypothetical protein [Cytobacillus pseudoceanisediminis]|uniref:hypothetical protein n=1 Tax=Cytobacillus pseudoceanisediminis TaxID=3051614 RepID=UPI003CF5F2E7